MFTVRRVGDPRTVNQSDIRLETATPREAAAQSQLATPGAQLVVTGPGITVRFHVDTIGRIREISRYTA